MSEFSISGRMVQGDPHKAQPPSKDPRTKAVKIDPKTGLPVNGRFFIAVAVEKNPAARSLVIPGLPTFEQVKAVLDADAKAAWPQYFPANGVAPRPELPAGCTNPTFSNKIVDGDGIDDKGQPYSRFEGYAGCWVVKFENGFAPKVEEWGDHGWVETVHTGRIVKPGDYVTVRGDTKNNGSTESPGMFMNFKGVAFEREGPTIATQSSFDPNEAYGQRGNAVQTGAAAANPPVTAATAPNSPTASPGEPPAPPPAGPVMLPAANGISYEAYKAKGWTDEVLRAQGYMA